MREKSPKTFKRRVANPSVQPETALVSRAELPSPGVPRVQHQTRLSGCSPASVLSPRAVGCLLPKPQPRDTHAVVKCHISLLCTRWLTPRRRPVDFFSLRRSTPRTSSNESHDGTPTGYSPTPPISPLMRTANHHHRAPWGKAYASGSDPAGQLPAHLCQTGDPCSRWEHAPADCISRKRAQRPA